MAHRSIGQERLGFAVTSERASSLNDLSRLIDCKRQILPMSYAAIGMVLYSNISPSLFVLTHL
jgi:hypothetical protein